MSNGYRATPPFRMISPWSPKSTKTIFLKGHNFQGSFTPITKRLTQLVLKDECWLWNRIPAHWNGTGLISKGKHIQCGYTGLHYKTTSPSLTVRHCMVSIEESWQIFWSRGGAMGKTQKTTERSVLMQQIGYYFYSKDKLSLTSITKCKFLFSSH